VSELHPFTSERNRNQFVMTSPHPIQCPFHSPLLQCARSCNCRIESFEVTEADSRWQLNTGESKGKPIHRSCLVVLEQMVLTWRRISSWTENCGGLQRWTVVVSEEEILMMILILLTSQLKLLLLQLNEKRMPKASNKEFACSLLVWILLVRRSKQPEIFLFFRQLCFEGNQGTDVCVSSQRAQ
jgi:hypothetical protein